MGAIKTIVKKELISYFNAPIAYVFAVAFLFISTGLYMMTFFTARLCDMRAFFSTLPLILVVFIPALTMRLWAEEKASGSLSLLLSLPVGAWELVWGKFLAGLLFCLLTLLGTMTIPLMLFFLGSPDPGPIVGGYLGAILLTAMLLAMGMGISALFADQIVAYILALLAGLVVYLLGTELVAGFIDGWFPPLGTFLQKSLGIVNHFADFSKGVISLGGLFFFVSQSLFWLLLNKLAVESLFRLRTPGTFPLAAALMFGILILANAIVSDLRLPRIDLTEGRLYTLSPTTKEVLARLRVPIRITYYVSPKEKLPTPMKVLPQEVRDILAELAALSPKVTYAIVNPETDPELARKLATKGIRPFATETIEKDTVSLKKIYSTIAISYLDKREELIDQVVPASLTTLEYDLVSRIFRLTMNRLPLIALYTPPVGDTTLAGPGDRFQLLREILEGQGYRVKTTYLSRESPIPKGADLLLILDPAELNDRALYEIERFLHSGRPVIVAAQGLSYTYLPDPSGILVSARPKKLAINKLLEAYGVRIREGILCDQETALLSLPLRRPMGLFWAVVHVPVDLPIQIQVLPEQMNPKVPVTAGLSGILYLWGSALEIEDKRLEKAGLKETVLFRSSPKAWEMESRPGPMDSNDFVPQGPRHSFPLAVLLEGRFPIFFKAPPPWPDEKSDEDLKKTPSPPASPETSLTSRLVVVGCSEMFSDPALEALSNAPFILNLVESLTLGGKMIHIRAKTQVLRFVAETSPAERIIWRLIVVFLIPGVVALAGAFRALSRRRRRERYLAELRQGASHGQS
ncbi:Gldg family protein [Thermosulfuriphilus sp.]